MKVESIHYERTLSDGAYGNRSLAATASINEGETITVAMAALILLVRDQLARDAAQEREDQEREDQEQRRTQDRARYRAQQAIRRQVSAVSAADPFGEGAHSDADDADEEEEPPRGRSLPF